MLFVCGCLIAVPLRIIVSRPVWTKSRCFAMGEAQSNVPFPHPLRYLVWTCSKICLWDGYWRRKAPSYRLISSKVISAVWSPLSTGHEISGFFSKLSPTCDQMGLLSHTTHADMFISVIFSLIQPRTLTSLSSWITACEHAAARVLLRLPVRESARSL